MMGDATRELLLVILKLHHRLEARSTVPTHDHQELLKFYAAS